MEEIQNLTQRQVALLKAIIEEYIETAEPVGSETLEKKYNLGVSPATIRNEMVRLTSMKLLSQPHTSSGRSPTPQALKYYVEHIMKTKDMTVADEVAVKEKIWDFRLESDKLLREATRALATKTKVLALTVTNDGDLYYSGAANILDMPEFYDFELTHSVLLMLDQSDYWLGILLGKDQEYAILLGEELKHRLLNQCGFVYARFNSPHVQGAIGVIGPSRLNYPIIIPVVRYMGRVIEEVAKAW